MDGYAKGGGTVSNQKMTANVPSTCQEVQQAAAEIVKSGLVDNAVFEYVTVGGVRYVRVDRWIPVTERLPDNNNNVWTWLDSGEGEEGYYEAPSGVRSGQWYSANYGNRYMENVTHWMPLPEPPKERTP